MKKQRQKRILELIEDKKVVTQKEIISLLQQDGFKVTQATVSRDIHDLGLFKSSPDGESRYISPHKSDKISEKNLSGAISSAIISIKYAQNNIVIKTMPGIAQAVASSVDRLDCGDILGCVAGDDTIIIVTEDTSASEKLAGELMRLLNLS